jgi:hypothetical protein
MNLVQENNKDTCKSAVKKVHFNEKECEAKWIQKTV